MGIVEILNGLVIPNILGRIIAARTVLGRRRNVFNDDGTRAFNSTR
jgi:hypothetical protein